MMAQTPCIHVYRGGGAGGMTEYVSILCVVLQQSSLATGAHYTNVQKRVDAAGCEGVRRTYIIL